MPGQRDEHDFLIIGKLCSLLQENGEKILSGQSRFALTTQSLGMLSMAFRRLSDVEYSDGGMSTAWSMSPQNTSKWKEDVNYMRDFISRCPSLKIIHGTNTMQGAVQVQRFRNLEILEMKKVPVHMIEGLHHLRGQLKTIIVSRSLQHLQDLFETCGSDMSSPMSWTQLSFVNISFNGLSRLDGSLRLLPAIEVLDLSHNSLEKTDNYLEYLTELQRLNLGYNMLDVVPSLSISAKNKLKTLVLKNNNLDNLEGIEDLVFLEELDLCDNCISDHNYLQPLSALVMLFQLKLSGNPITYHSSHRRLTLQNISSLALSTKFELDCKNVTSSELTYVKGAGVSPARRPSAIAHTVISDTGNNRPTNNIISRDYKFEESDNIATSLPVASSRKKRKRSKLKFGTDMSDIESSTTEFDSPDTSAASSPRPDYLRAAMQKRQEIELFRNHYGPDWLRAMEEDQMSSRQNDQVTSGTSDSDTNHPTSTKADTEQPMDIDSPKNDPTDDDLYLLETSGSFQKPAALPVIVNGVHDELKVKENGDVTKSLDEDKEESPDGIYSTSAYSKTNLHRLESVRGNEWRRTEKEEAEFYGEESEPFIVMIENEDYKQMILVLNDRYLIEKDLNGCVVDKFDLKFLKSFECSDVSVIHDNVDDNVIMPQVVLNYDYVKKDRREKSYVMEDSDNVQLLLDLLQPFLSAQDLKSANNSLYQCLKCSKQFLAKDGIRKVQSSEIPSKGSSRDLEIMNKSGTMFYKCPKCGSELVIEVEHQEKLDTGSATNTPQGSYTSGSYLDTRFNSLPNKTSPLAKSTPSKKANDSTEQKEREDSAKKSLFKKPKNTSHVSTVVGSGDDFLDPVTEGRVRSNAFISQSNSTELANSESQNTEALKFVSSSVPSRGGIAHHASRTRIPSESDITILHTASEASLDVTPNQSTDSLVRKLHQQLSLTVEEHVDTSSISEDNSTITNSEAMKTREGDLTPVGSPLSYNVCNDMVSSVYLSSVAAESSGSHLKVEKADTSDISVLCDDSEETANDSIYNMSTKSLSSIDDDIHVVKVTHSRDDSIISIAGTDDSSSYKVLSVSESTETCNSVQENFTDVDHRLKLHLMMSLFENTEEFLCLLETDVCQYLIADEYLAYVVLSTDKLYILKITSENRSDPPASWLICLDIQPITELYHVDMGLGCQNVRLEFGTDCSCYTLIIRDEKRCQDFVNHLEELLKSELFAGHQIKTFFSKEVLPLTIKQLTSDVLTKKNGEAKILVSYLLGFLVRGMNPKYPVSFVITDEELILVKENHQWPQPRLQAPLDKDTIAKHFTVLEKHKITNIVTVEKFEEADTKLRLTLLDEESGGESMWNVTMATQNGRELFIQGIREPWEAEFGVDLDITDSVLEEI